VKWTSRILILAIFIAAVFGCQKGQKAAVSKEGRSSTSTKSASVSTKARAKSTTATTKSSTSTTKTASTGGKPSAAHTVHPGVLTVSDNSRTFDVKRGEGITVKLESNHATGFGWHLGEELGAVIKQEGGPTYMRNTTKSGKVTSGGVETWHFRTAGTGRETVKLEYRRSWENMPERTFRFSVIVH